MSNTAMFILTKSWLVLPVLMAFLALRREFGIMSSALRALCFVGLCGGIVVEIAPVPGNGRAAWSFWVEEVVWLFHLYVIALLAWVSGASRARVLLAEGAIASIPAAMLGRVFMYLLGFLAIDLPNRINDVSGWLDMSRAIAAGPIAPGLGCMIPVWWVVRHRLVRQGAGCASVRSE